MPEFTYTSEGEHVLQINSSTGIATFKGKRYRTPCTLEAENGRSFVKEIPLDLVATIDFSRIQAVHTFGNGEALHISLASWNDVFMLEDSYVMPTSLVGSKRCF